MEDEYIIWWKVKRERRKRDAERWTGMVKGERLLGKCEGLGRVKGGWWMADGET